MVVTLRWASRPWMTGKRRPSWLASRDTLRRQRPRQPRCPGKPPDMVNIKKCKNSPFIPCLLGGLDHFYFHIYIGNNHPNWLIFFGGVETLYHVLGAKINGGSEQLGMVFSPSKWLWPPETTWDERNAQKGDTWETWWDRSGHNWWPS